MVCLRLDGFQKQPRLRRGFQDRTRAKYLELSSTEQSPVVLIPQGETAIPFCWAEIRKRTGGNGWRWSCLAICWRVADAVGRTAWDERAACAWWPGRQECWPQAGKPAPHRTRHGGHGKSKPQRGRAATKQVWRHKKSSRAEKNLRASSTENTEDTEKNKPRRTRRWEERGRTRWSAPTLRGIGWRRGRWVKGAQAGWKAGPTIAACTTAGRGWPTKRACAPKAGQRGAEAIRRQDWRRGTQDCVLHGEAGVGSLAACST